MGTAVAGVLVTTGLVALTPQAAMAAEPCGSAVVARSNGTYAWGTLLSSGPLCGRNQARIYRYSGGLRSYVGPIGATSSVTASNGTNAGNDWRWGLQGGSLSGWRGCPVNYNCYNDGTRYRV